MTSNIIPVIDNGKEPNEPVKFELLFNMPSNSPYGNLLLKKLKIVNRLDHTNIRIRELYSRFKEFGLLTNSENEHLTEEIVFNIRRTVDELIGLIYLKEYFSKNNKYPQKIEIDSIGSYIKKRDHNPILILENHYSFLKLLNDISNVQKHSFINSDINLVGKEEPLIIALGLKENDLTKTPQLYTLPLKILIDNFNHFYKEVNTKEVLQFDI